MNSMRWSSKKASFEAGRIVKSILIVRRVELIWRRRFGGVRLSYADFQPGCRSASNFDPRIASVDNVTEGSGRSCRRLGSRR